VVQVRGAVVAPLLHLKIENMVNQKSIDSFKELQKGIISVRQFEVLRCLNIYGPQTNRMLAEELGWDINRVTGRVSELRTKNLVGHHSDYYDNDTKRTVNMWKCL
jgi:DNA-binding MarR family transcriptional regulator|tara:strand:- start:794 stop:1108 length:315 start_codon:yes stop_codon:yes gene_type:complete